MESLYWVLSWVCHRACHHCYEDRFHPYPGDTLGPVLTRSIEAFPHIIENLPDRMTYLDVQDAAPDGTLPEKRGSIILAGGEVLAAIPGGKPTSS